MYDYDLVIKVNSATSVFNIILIIIAFLLYRKFKQSNEKIEMLQQILTDIKQEIANNKEQKKEV